MANTNAISTAGSHVYYAVEATAGTRPTEMTAYTEIPEVVEIPDLGSDINTLDTTSLAQEKSHTYIEGLADSGGAFALTVNDCNAFREVWDEAVTASETGYAAGKATWICVVMKGMDEAFYIPGKLARLGFGGLSVDEVIQNTANILPTGDYLYAAKPTV